MKKTRILPTTVVDDFFEIPTLWRHYALKQTYTRDVESPWPGTRTATIAELNPSLFHSFASTLIKYIPGAGHFRSLQVNFASVEESYGEGWVHYDEPQWNVAGVVYLNIDPPPNSGTLIFNKVGDTTTNYNKIFMEMLASPESERAAFQKYQLEQRMLYKRTMTVHNKFNRCLIFSPAVHHSPDTNFGNTLETSRITLNFFGHAV